MKYLLVILSFITVGVFAQNGDQPFYAEIQPVKRYVKSHCSNTDAPSAKLWIKNTSNDYLFICFPPLANRSYNVNSNCLHFSNTDTKSNTLTHCFWTTDTTSSNIDMKNIQFVCLEPTEELIYLFFIDQENHNQVTEAKNEKQQYRMALLYAHSNKKEESTEKLCQSKSIYFTKLMVAAIP